MLAGLNSRQLSEMYAFANIEPLDEPLQKMFAELTSVLARVHGNDLGAEHFMLTKKALAPTDDKALRTQQIAQLFARAANHNNKVH